LLNSRTFLWLYHFLKWQWQRKEKSIF
jgi:hypothetical protein